MVTTELLKKILGLLICLLLSCNMFLYPNPHPGVLISTRTEYVLSEGFHWITDSTVGFTIYGRTNAIYADCKNDSCTYWAEESGLPNLHTLIVNLTGKVLQFEDQSPQSYWSDTNRINVSARYFVKNIDRPYPVNDTHGGLIYFIISHDKQVYSKFDSSCILSLNGFVLGDWKKFDYVWGDTIF